MSKSKFNCCEDHFNLENDMENYMQYKTVGGKIQLKHDVVPHIFKRQKTESYMAKRPCIEFNIDVTELSQPSTSGCSSSENVSVATVVIDTMDTKNTVGVQVKPSTSSKGTMCSLNSRESEFKRPLSPTHSIPSSEEVGSSILDMSSDSTKTDISESKKGDVKIWLLISKKPKEYLGVPKKWFSFIIKLLSKETKLPEENIILTLMKIKLNDSFSRLADMFGVSTSTASRIFKKTILSLEPLFTLLIQWPSPDKIKYYLPIGFWRRYSKVQSIIDCFEIEIQKPSNPLKQSLTWSNYKNGNTIKYLISATPDGYINYISNGYGGRITDSALLKECDYFNVLPEKYDVMADRGFKEAGRLLHGKKCRLVRPPSVSSARKPSRLEVLETKRIASLRIYIERVISRVREFAYLKPHSTINTNLIGHTDGIVKIVCGLINLQNDLIKNM